jgi:hypothetical protein
LNFSFSRFSHSTKSFTLTETPSIFIPGKYPQSATITRSFYLALLYYALLNKHLYFPWAWQADPAEARTIICFLQVLNFTISAIFSVDVLQSLSILLVHGLLGITPLVSNGEKSRDEKVATVQKEVKKFINIPEPARVPVREPIPVDIKHTKKESKKKK